MIPGMTEVVRGPWVPVRGAIIGNARKVLWDLKEMGESLCLKKVAEAFKLVAFEYGLETRVELKPKEVGGMEGEQMACAKAKTSSVWRMSSC